MNAAPLGPDTPLSTALSLALAQELTSWGVDQGACALIDVDGVIATAGDTALALPWASVTKVVAALAVLDVVHDGLLSLDAPAGPPGATVRHLLGHASGLAFDEERSLAAPGRRRIYSNVGINCVVDAAVAAAGALNPAALLADRVLRPLGMDRTTLVGPPAHGATGPVDDLARLAAELLDPRILRAGVVDDAITPSFPGLAGILPGFGRQDPNDWGLGVELRGHKAPHWMPVESSAQTFGHFGQSGSFLWVEREISLAAVALTGTAFGPWAAQAWPRSSGRWLAIWDHFGRAR